jgi:NADPH2:quinone reductase
MRAGIIDKPGDIPRFGEFPDPQAKEGCILIDVSLTGLGGWDILGAYRLGVQYPCVVRGEGIGYAEDGRRVYFGERSELPFGSWAERTIVPAAEVWDVPEGVDDKLALNMGIAATGVFVPLRKAAIQPDESVLILGATGVLGQIALQLARIMGAGRIVGAGRDVSALQRLMDRGLADAVVQLKGDVDGDANALRAAAAAHGTPLKSFRDDDAAALMDQAPREGFDMVLDLVCGNPMLSAIKATRWGGRVNTIGRGAGHIVELNMRDLLFRQIGMVGTGQRLPADRKAIWLELIALGLEHNITIDELDVPFEEITEAWKAQAAAPHAKITARIRP